MQKNLSKVVKLLVLFVWALSVAPIPAQEKPADNMDILRDKLKADKKLLVAEYMQLSESEAPKFWPVYDAYQKELDQINQRLYKLIETYAGYYNTNTLTDEKAKALTDEALAIESAEVELKKSYVAKLSSVLPGVKVARFVQIENKVRAVVKFEIAAYVPMAPQAK